MEKIQENMTTQILKNVVSDEDALAIIRRICAGQKHNGKRFLAKLIAIEPLYFVFETKTVQVMRTRKDGLASLKAVA